VTSSSATSGEFGTCLGYGMLWNPPLFLPYGWEVHFIHARDELSAALTNCPPQKMILVHAKAPISAVRKR
jgi:hypothetical protein